MSIDGEYFSLTPGHKKELTLHKISELRKDHFLFNDVSSDSYLKAAGIADDWPHGRGIWISSDYTRIVWVGEEDHLRIIFIQKGNDLGLSDVLLYELIQAIEAQSVVFAIH